MFLFCLCIIGINVDFQLDRDTNSVPYVIVNYGVPYSDLIFQKQDTAYMGEYLVSLVLKKDNYQLGGKSKKNKLHQESEIQEDITKLISIKSNLF